jgi:glycosyltransferase involved in cell wall biosynthesis
VSVAIVLNEARRTGPPRIAGLIASALQQHRQVRILCLEDGPLVGWLQECAGPQNVRVLDTETPGPEAGFGDRINAAQTALQGETSQIIYVNSLATSEFIVAAKAAGKLAVLHLHEDAAQMRDQLARQVTRPEIVSLCDGVVLAAPRLRQDLLDLFSAVPERSLIFGSAVDSETLDRSARAGKLLAKSAAGVRYKTSGRLLVGMVGQASAQKGSDIFFEAAKALPEHDFMWVGSWSGNGQKNPVHEEFLRARLPNFFISGSVGNPYRYLSKFDVFFLSSRDDLNPLSLVEALCLGVPVLAFSAATSMPDFLGRSCILCHGQTNLPDAVRVLRAIKKPEIGLLSFDARVKEYRKQFDIKHKVIALVDMLASLEA